MAAPMRIASRRSELALVQAHFIQDRLGGEIVEVTSSGDQDVLNPLYTLPGMGVFVRALETKLLSGEADLAVHSLKDMPTDQPEGLILAAVPAITLPRGDVVLMNPRNQHLSLDTLPPHSVIGTSSLRRLAYLNFFYREKEFQTKVIRGNLNTRLRKLNDLEEGYDCLILAAAGVHRLGWHERMRLEYLDEKQFLYAPGQAALGLECQQDSPFLSQIQGLNDVQSRLRCDAERSFMKELEGGCKVPIGVWSGIEDTGELHLIGQVWHTSRNIEIRGNVGQAAALGRALADAMKAKGAAEILSEIRAQHDQAFSH